MSIAGLNEAVPQDNAFVGDGAGEIRALKAAIKAVFPGADAAITKPAGYNGNASTTPTSADFSQLFTDINALFTGNSNVVPIGTVVAWFGNPTETSAINAQGWYVADGGTYNGFATPDLRNRFVKGWDGTDNRGTVTAGSLSALATSSAYAVGTALAATPTPKVVDTSARQFTLSEANIPQHRHLLAVNTDSTRNSFTPGTNLSSSASLVTSATAGSGDSEYEASGTAVEPNTFQSGAYGSSSVQPISIDIDLSAADFDHQHKVDLSGSLEPAHFVMGFICYCGVAA